jgi:AcrR family transcriptional regulator
METQGSSSNRILRSALDLFANKGYEATAVREICEAAGLTKPTLYHFYGNKEGVLRALVEGALDGFHQQVLARAEGPGSPQERLTGVVRDYFEAAQTNGDLMRLLFGLIHNPHTSVPPTKIPQRYQEFVAILSGVVDEGVRIGAFCPGPTDVRMLVFMGALSECAHGYLLVGQPELTPALAATLVDTIFRGWI